MRILVCSESPLVEELLRQALQAGGHQVLGAREPAALASAARDAGALLVEVHRARQAVALLRDRGFAGRALVAGDEGAAALEEAAREADADGVLPLSPPESLGARFAQAVGGRRRVLVVDDSELAARLVAEELRAGGFEVVVAHDVESATSAIVKRPSRPDLVLLDIHMPKVNGAQFCRFIKRNEMFRSIKVFFCSADSKAEVARLASECGADGFVLKNELLGKWISQNV